MRFVVVGIVALMLLAGCGDDNDSDSQTPTETVVVQNNFQPPVREFEILPIVQGYNCVVYEVTLNSGIRAARKKCSAFLEARYGPDIPDGTAVDFQQGMSAAQECIQENGKENC